MKNAFVKGLVCVALAVAVLATAGCQKKISRCVLSGTVTNDGQAVPTGTIQFIPQNADPTLQVSGASADIVDGHYELSPDMGLVEGKYKVCIIAKAFKLKKTGEIIDPNDMKDGIINPLDVIDEDLVPPKFGVESEQFVDVGKGKTMTYDVNMTK